MSTALLALASSLGHCSTAAASCEDEYESRSEEWFTSSGESLIRTEAGRPRGLQDWEWGELHFSRVEKQLWRCWSLGARYWEVLLDFAEYRDRIWFELPPQIWTDGEEFRARMNLLPRQILAGICAPVACNDTQMREVVTPRFLAETLRLVIDLPPPKPHEFQTSEMSHWSSLHLDFALAGVCHCGTTSLYKNLEHHADIAFTSVGKEDAWFKRSKRFLPYKADVNAFNKARLKKPAALFGIEDCNLFPAQRIRLALASMPNIRVVLLVCDPLGRYEKHFWSERLCRGSGPWSHTQPDLLDKARRCWHSPADGLSHPELLEEMAVGEDLKDLQRLLGSRLHVLHQDSLRHAGQASYEEILRFIGASQQGFPAEFQFRRYNSQPGHRTELCRNASMLAHLQHRMASEYQALMELLQASGRSIPDSLRRQQTRCDRPEELLEQH